MKRLQLRNLDNCIESCKRNDFEDKQVGKINFKESKLFNRKKGLIHFMQKFVKLHMFIRKNILPIRSIYKFNIEINISKIPIYSTIIQIKEICLKTLQL